MLRYCPFYFYLRFICKFEDLFWKKQNNIEVFIFTIIIYDQYRLTLSTFYAHKILWWKCASITTCDNFKNGLLYNVLLQKYVFKLQWCVKLAYFNVIEINSLVLLSFALFIKISVKKFDKMIIWQKVKLPPFPNSL